MVTRKKLHRIAILIGISICITSIIFLSLVNLSQVYGTNIFFYDNTPYDFKVKSESVSVYMRKDGGIDIYYTIDFQTYGYGIPIVDIGFPNNFYDLLNIEATIDGTPITDIRRSQYLMCGIELHLGNNAIKPYTSGSLWVKASNPIMIFRDDLEPFQLASIEFTPTWFDPYICRNVDYLEVNFFLPEGFMEPDQVKWHYIKPYSIGSSFSGGIWRLHYQWRWTNTRPQQNTIGVSFPQTAVNTFYDSWLFSIFSPLQKFFFTWIIIFGTIFSL